MGLVSMYAPSTIDIALDPGQTWPSEAHKRVAACALCFNDRVNNLDELSQGVQIINSYSEAEIKLVTVEALREKGLPV
jgi:hypothetical protein